MLLDKKSPSVGYGSIDCMHSSTQIYASVRKLLAKTNPVSMPQALILASPNRRVYDQANRRVCVLQSPQHTRAADSAQSHLDLV